MTRAAEAASSPSQAVAPAEPASAPDASVITVTSHARALAALVRANVDALATARVTAADAVSLERLAGALEAREREWLHGLDTQSFGQVAKLRAPLREGRDDLFEALRTFADEDDATQRALDDISGVDNDEDLISDTTRLLDLCKRHKRDLQGTEITAARLEAVAAALQEFHVARSTTQHFGRVVGGALEAARDSRNQAFWALATLTRTVVKRARFALRRDPARAAQFSGYHNALRRRKKAVQVAPAPVPVPDVTTPVVH